MKRFICWILLLGSFGFSLLQLPLSNAQSSKTPDLIEPSMGFQVTELGEWIPSLFADNGIQDSPAVAQRTIGFVHKTTASLMSLISSFSNPQQLSPEQWVKAYDYHRTNANYTQRSLQWNHYQAVLIHELHPTEQAPETPDHLRMVLAVDNQIVVIEYVGYAVQSEAFERWLNQVSFFPPQAFRPSTLVGDVKQAFEQANQPLAISVQNCCGVSDPEYNPFPCNSAAGNGNCTWWVRYRRTGDNTANLIACTGNANTWDECAAQHYPQLLSNTPTVGSAVVWMGANDNHVAFLESMANGNSLTMSQMNWGGPCPQSTITQTAANKKFIRHPQAAPTYSGEFHAQSYPGKMLPGSRKPAMVQIRNTGTATWDANTRLAPMPQDQASPFYDSATWISAGRIVSAGTVAPGQIGSFNFHLRAPNEPGTYRIHFAVVQEGVTWFSQPVPNQIWFEILITPAVGIGSSRQQLFVEAYQRNGGEAVLGFPETPAVWSGPANAPQQAVIQRFDSGGYLIHDELKDQPFGSVPAYFINGDLLLAFQNAGGSSSALGAGPSSDQFLNSQNQAQQNFPSGQLIKNGSSIERRNWPEPIQGQWRAEYHNGTNLEPAGATWVQNEPAISYDWGENIPGNGRWGVWGEHFSVRWKGNFNFVGGDYQFNAGVDDQLKVWIDNQLVIDTTMQHVQINRWLSPGNHQIRVEMREITGAAMVYFNWQPAAIACTITIDNGAVYTNQLNVTINSNVPNAHHMILSNDGGFINSVWQSYNTSTQWTIADPGMRIATLNLYSRFRNSDSQELCNGTLSDDIIYDPLPPTLNASFTQASTIQPQQARLSQSTIMLEAVDQAGGSGIDQLQISSFADFHDAAWQAYSTRITTPATQGSVVYLRVRDGAGNISATEQLIVPNIIFMPYVTR